MASPIYATDLTVIGNAETYTSDVAGTWSIYGGTGGSSPGVGIDFAVQGSNAIDMKITSSNGRRGPVIGPTTPVSLGNRELYYVWAYVATPGILTEGAIPAGNQATGLCLTAANNLNNTYLHLRVREPSSYGEKGRVGECFAWDPSYYTSSSQTELREVVGSPSEPFDFIGATAAFAQNSKGSNFAVDAISYGTGAYVYQGDTTTPATLEGLDTVLNGSGSTDRLGTVVSPLDGVYEINGGLHINQDPSTGAAYTSSDGYFSDTGSTLFFKQVYGGSFSSDWKCNFIIDGDSSRTNTVLFDGTSILGDALSSYRPWIQILGNVTATFTNCTFSLFRLIQITTTGAVSFTGCKFSGFRAAEGSLLNFQNLIASSNTTFENCEFGPVNQNNSNTTSIVSIDLAKLDNCLFKRTTSSAVSLHAVNAGTVNTAGTINWNSKFSDTQSGFATSDGSTGNEHILIEYTDTSNPLVISVAAGADTPSVNNTGAGTVNVVTAQTTLTLTGIVSNSEVRIYSSGTTTELAGVESTIASTFQYSYTYSASTFVDIVVHNVGYVYYRVDAYELGAADASLPIAQIFDRNYSNP